MEEGGCLETGTEVKIFWFYVQKWFNCLSASSEGFLHCDLRQIQVMQCILFYPPALLTLPGWHENPRGAPEGSGPSDLKCPGGHLSLSRGKSRGL